MRCATGRPLILDASSGFAAKLCGSLTQTVCVDFDSVVGWIWFSLRTLFMETFSAWCHFIFDVIMLLSVMVGSFQNASNQLRLLRVQAFFEQSYRSDGHQGNASTGTSPIDVLWKLWTTEGWAARAEAKSCRFHSNDGPALTRLADLLVWVWDKNQFVRFFKNRLMCYLPSFPEETGSSLASSDPSNIWFSKST